MFSYKVLLLVLVSLSSFSAAQHCRKVDTDKSSGYCTVPDPTLTPGEMDASLACVERESSTRGQRFREEPDSGSIRLAL